MWQKSKKKISNMHSPIQNASSMSDMGKTWSGISWATCMTRLKVHHYGQTSTDYYKYSGHWPIVYYEQNFQRGYSKNTSRSSIWQKWTNSNWDTSQQVKYWYTWDSRLRSYRCYSITIEVQPGY